MAKYLDLKVIPFQLLTFARKCGNNRFYETMGEFIDIVPMVFPADIDLDSLKSCMRERILHSFYINNQNRR